MAEGRSMTYKRYAAISLAVVAAGCLAVAGIAAVRRASPVPCGSTLPPTSQSVAYDYSGTVGSNEEHLPDHREASGASLASSVQQWPTDPHERMLAMTGRLDRVATALNEAGGTQILVVLGQTDRVAFSQGSGIITVDFSFLWRLSEDALAVLIAHEFGHEVLNHQERLELLDKEKGQSGYVQRLRAIESEADEFAGRLVALTEYRPTGMGELLRHVQSTAWENPLVRTYYPHPTRVAAFEGAWRQARELPPGDAVAGRATPRKASPVAQRVNN